MDFIENQVEAAVPEASEVTEGQETAAQQRRPAEGANRFAFLAKKEAAIVRQRHELKAQMEAMTSQRSEMEKLRAEIDEVKGRKASYRSNPLAALEDAGLSYKELTDFILNNNTVSTESQIKALQDKISEVESARQRDHQEREEHSKRQAAEREVQVIAEFKNEISNFISSKKDDYELTNLYESSDLVYDTVEAYFEKTSKVLSIPEACQLVETYLEKQVEKSLQTKKLGSRFQKPAEQPIAKQDPSAPRRTLNNQNYTSSTPSMVSPKVENDRMSRALAALDL
jgi:predicted phage-related endonuclease